MYGVCMYVCMFVCLYGIVVCTPKHGVYVHVLIMPGDVILKGMK